eukprot:14463-Eustigmatos_ZCMA.PRE.1
MTHEHHYPGTTPEQSADMLYEAHWVITYCMVHTGRELTKSCSRVGRPFRWWRMSCTPAE